MNAVNLYRTQQLAIAAAIDSGDYEKASDLLRRDLRTFAAPERAAPERSGTTGHNQTLTAPRKCGIIKAIRRHLRRVKRNQEGKTMKKYAVYTHYDSNKSVIGYIIPQFDNGIAFITQRTYNKLLKKRTVGGTAGIYSDYPGEIRITNNDKTEFIGYMQ